MKKILLGLTIGASLILCGFLLYQNNIHLIDKTEAADPAIVYSPNFPLPDSDVGYVHAIALDETHAIVFFRHYSSSPPFTGAQPLNARIATIKNGQIAYGNLFTIEPLIGSTGEIAAFYGSGRLDSERVIIFYRRGLENVFRVVKADVYSDSITTGDYVALIGSQALLSNDLIALSDQKAAIAYVINPNNQGFMRVIEINNLTISLGPAYRFYNQPDGIWTVNGSNGMGFARVTSDTMIIGYSTLAASGGYTVRLGIASVSGNQISGFSSVVEETAIGRVDWVNMNALSSSRFLLTHLSSDGIDSYGNYIMKVNYRTIDVSGINLSLNQRFYVDSSTDSAGILESDANYMFLFSDTGISVLTVLDANNFSRGSIFPYPYVSYGFGYQSRSSLRPNRFIAGQVVAATVQDIRLVNVSGVVNTYHNVYGWAWSDNIGWMSFNCKNDYNGNGTMGPDYMAELEDRCDDSNYGVDIATSTGIFSGYAWSDNIGWISFNQSDLTNCPSAPCNASVNLTTGKITGWAKAINATPGDNDYGWISLDGTNYGLNIGDGYFHNHAWGGGPNDKAVIGWASFNCEEGGATGGNICGTKNYLVWTDLRFNHPPYVEDPSFTPPPDFCASPLNYFLNWTFRDIDAGDYENAYELALVNVVTGASTTYSLSGFGSTITDNTAQNLPLAVRSSENLGASPPQITYGQTYNWRVRVEDHLGLWSNWISWLNFTVPQKYPQCSFTISPAKPRIGDKITFTDTSVPGPYPIDSWSWNFGDGTANCPSNCGTGIARNPTHTYYSVIRRTVTLTITDTDSGGNHRSCSNSQSFNIRPGNPDYDEVIPR